MRVKRKSEGEGRWQPSLQGSAARLHTPAENLPRRGVRIRVKVPFPKFGKKTSMSKKERHATTCHFVVMMCHGGCFVRCLFSKMIFSVLYKRPITSEELEDADTCTDLYDHQRSKAVEGGDELPLSFLRMQLRTYHLQGQQ